MVTTAAPGNDTTTYRTNGNGATVPILASLTGMLVIAVLILVAYIVKVRLDTPKHRGFTLHMVNARPASVTKVMGQTVGTQVNLGDLMSQNMAVIPECEDIRMRNKSGTTMSDCVIYHTLLEDYGTDRLSHPYEDVVCTNTTLRPLAPATVNTRCVNPTRMTAHRPKVTSTQTGEGSEMQGPELRAGSIQNSSVNNILPMENEPECDSIQISRL
ncbi:uncharacterized protein LOC124261200 [Haliotis rubra]|uniref:uncharacterized protein LOC124261200 n=1 Tax=Haliotis rubra TaxID=36100 RepID=UPI001EE600DA|nr:uncharacterized protein LOC124261200 [Haliotis rubra]